MDLYFILFIYLIISGLIGKFIFKYILNLINKSLKDNLYLLELIFICFCQISIITLLLMYGPH